jgi:hypothetical protein
MSENIFNNIIVLIIIFIIIKQMSPNPDSLLFILKKYLNFIIYKIKSIFKSFFNKNEEFSNFFRTFKGLPTFNPKAPSFKSSYEISFINYFKMNNPSVTEKQIENLYYFIQTLVNINGDQYFSTPSESTINKFSEIETNKIKDILLKKLNSSTFKFDNLIFESELTYYLNFSGKQVEPFIINIDSNLGKLRIYIDLDIRNDIYQNKEYIVINEIKPLKGKQIIFNNKNIYNNNLEKNNNITQKSEEIFNYDNSSINSSQPTNYDNASVNINYDNQPINSINYENLN